MTKTSRITAIAVLAGLSTAAWAGATPQVDATEPGDATRNGDGSMAQQSASVRGESLLSPGALALVAMGALLCCRRKPAPTLA